MPGLKVVAPYDAADAKGLLKAAIRDPNPVIFLEHEMLYGHEFDVPDVEDWLVPIGKAKVRRAGGDVTLTAHSRMVGYALEAAEELAADGIEAEVIDLRTLRPLDHATVVESVKKTNRLVTVRGRLGPDGRRRRGGRARGRAGLRLARRAAGAGAPGRRAAALRGQPGGAVAALGGQDRERGQGGLLPMSGDCLARRRLPLRRGALRGRCSDRGRGAELQLLDLRA